MANQPAHPLRSPQSAAQRQQEIERLAREIAALEQYARALATESGAERSAMQRFRETLLELDMQTKRTELARLLKLDRAPLSSREPMASGSGIHLPRPNWSALGTLGA